MSRINVVYWSQTGNTEEMAEAIGKGITQAGGEAVVSEVSAISPDALKMRMCSLLAARQWEQKCLRKLRWNRLSKR